MVLLAAQHHFGVDFIRNHDDAAPAADFGEALQGLDREADPARVVRVAEDENPGPVIYNGLEVVKVHLVCLQEALLIIYRFEWIIDDLESAGHSHIAERMIDRRLDDHLVSWLQEAALSLAYALYNARNETEMLRSDLPAMQ